MSSVANDNLVCFIAADAILGKTETETLVKTLLKFKLKINDSKRLNDQIQSFKDEV